MTLNILLSKLKQSDADAWEVISTKTRGWEFYFIRKRLDQNRAKDIDEIEVKVYKKTDNGEEMGSAAASVPPATAAAPASRCQFSRAASLAMRIMFCPATVST